LSPDASADAPDAPVAPDAPGDGPPAASGDVWWIGAESMAPATISNRGVRTRMTIRGDAPPVGCVDMWVSETIHGGLWGQIGYEACNVGGPTIFDAFYQVWDTTTDPGAELGGGQTLAITEGLHDFAMYQSNGSRWNYAVDGHVIASYDMGGEQSDGASYLDVLCEEANGVDTPYVPPATIVSDAMSALGSDGSWTQVPSADVYNTSGIAGVVGQSQDAELALDQVQIGSGTTFLDPNTTLWDGAARPDIPLTPFGDAGTPFLALVAPSGGATVSGTVSMQASASAVSGVQSVELLLDGTVSLCVLTSPPYACGFDSTTTTDGSHYLQATLTDAAGHTVLAYNTVVVENGAGARPTQAGAPTRTPLHRHRSAGRPPRL
jgi:hypothetical protein